MLDKHCSLSWIRKRPLSSQPTKYGVITTVSFTKTTRAGDPAANLLPLTLMPATPTSHCRNSLSSKSVGRTMWLCRTTSSTEAKIWKIPSPLTLLKQKCWFTTLRANRLLFGSWCNPLMQQEWTKMMMSTTCFITLQQSTRLSAHFLRQLRLPKT